MLPATIKRPEADALWPHLTTADRRMAAVWIEIICAVESAPDKALAVAVAMRDYAGQVKGLSRTGIYQRIAAWRAEGLAGLVGARAIKRAVYTGEKTSNLPPAFITFWKGLCGLHQRRKVLPAWRALMRKLINGDIIPGYETDWRGIWLADNPGATLPAACPYMVDRNRRRYPEGWGYDNLRRFAPEADVWVGAAVGVQAMRFAGAPSIPHTRAGTTPMSVISIDDIQFDLFVTHLGKDKAERPVGLGLIDICTGRYASWSVIPVRRREDDSRIMLDKSIQRYQQAHVFCGIGIAQGGIIELLEHGAASMTPEEVARINAILGPMPGGGPWLTVQRGATTGAPIFKGLFTERGRGNPHHKSPLESMWGRLHNDLAMLPAQAGKDWDSAPQSIAGREATDRKEMALIAKISEKYPVELALIRRNASSYRQFCRILNEVIAAINGRTDHALEGWEACGFTKQIVELPGQDDIDLAPLLTSGDPRAAAFAGAAIAAGSVRTIRMSPDEAWNTATAREPLKRWPLFIATQILGDELAHAVTVKANGTFRVPSVFGEEAYEFAARGLDWSPVFFSENAPFPSALLNHHYPHVPNLGDMTRIKGTSYHGKIDLLAGGTPCQGFSVAGHGHGLNDPRSRLSLDYIRLCDEIRPSWILWENVPGCLTTNKGRDFARFITGLQDLGYSLAWRVLDGQYS